MINEGAVTGSGTGDLRSVMVRQLERLGTATPDEWERAVFRTLNGHAREDVDWDVEDNQAGYYTWVKSFDGFIKELVEDGFVDFGERDGKPVCLPAEADPPIGWSQAAYPSRES
ncbi:MAG: hypothetical protein ACYS99_14925 [Planctomycetota bacterium]|jgi:hypothetical protein